MKFIKSSLMGISVIFTAMCMINSMNAMEPESIWVATEDGQKITIPMWQVDQIKVLKRALSRQQGANSYHEPVAVRIDELKLSLVQKGLDILKNSGNFCNFYKDLGYNQQIKFDAAVDELEVDMLDKALEKCSLPGSKSGPTWRISF
jgi:hypothetical protein